MTSTVASLIGSNWKMTFTPSEARAFLTELRGLVGDVTDRSLFVLPSYPALAVASEILAGSNIAWGAQNVHAEERGAYTGEVSAAMLADLGCTYAMVGHFERRRDWGETDSDVAAKVAAIQRWAMTPLVCVGEPEHLPPAAALRYVSSQLRSLGAPDYRRMVIAYEPGWAIGAGGTPASTETIRYMHAGIRRTLVDLAPEGAGVPIISGGSVDLAGATALLAQPNVNGLFVGRSAYDAQTFSAIIHTKPSSEGPRT